MGSIFRLRMVLFVSALALLASAMACVTGGDDSSVQSSIESTVSETTSGVSTGQTGTSGLERNPEKAIMSDQYLGVSELPPSNSQDRGIWVTGSGAVEVEPDMAVVRLGVTALAKTVAVAQAQAGQYMADVQEAVLSEGVLLRDIQTVDYSIRPEYHYEDVTIGSRRQTKRVLDGYRVTNNAVVKLRQMGREGEIIDALSTAGGDFVVIDDISFVLDDTADVHIVARERAIIDATNKAEQIAATMGVKLGRPLYVREISATTYEDPAQQMYGVARAYEESAMTTPIMGGVLDITVKVSVVFAIGY